MGKAEKRPLDDVVYGDEEQKEREAAKKQRDAELADLRGMLKSPGAKRFFRRTMAFCGLFRCAFVGNARVYFHTGQRNVASWLLGEILEAEPDPQFILDVLYDAKKEEQSDDS